MKPETITLDRLEALIELLDASLQTVRRVRRQSLQGQLGPKDAAVTINEVSGTIHQFCKK